MTADRPITVEFLNPEEAAKVDAALLSSQEKFLARVTIYALRSLGQISAERGIDIEEITPDLVAEWVQRDRNIHQQVDMDASFVTFFSNLIVSSLKPLHQISAESGKPIADITIEQVLEWFEREAKRRVET